MLTITKLFEFIQPSRSFTTQPSRLGTDDTIASRGRAYCQLDHGGVLQAAIR